MNIAPEEVYQKVKDELDLYKDKGQFFDRKTKAYVNFTDISNINGDIQIKFIIDVVYSHNYGIAFWILFQNHTDILNPINIIYQYHM